MKLRDFYENMKDILDSNIKVYNKDYIQLHEGNVASLETLSDDVLDVTIQKTHIGSDKTFNIVLCSFEKEYTIDEITDMFNKMGVNVKNTDGSYRTTFDVLADIGEVLSKTKEELE